MTSHCWFIVFTSRLFYYDINSLPLIKKKSVWDGRKLLEISRQRKYEHSLGSHFFMSYQRHLLEIIALLPLFQDNKQNLPEHEALATELNHFIFWANHGLAPQCLFAGHRGSCRVINTTVVDIFGWQWDCWGQDAHSYALLSMVTSEERTVGSHRHCTGSIDCTLTILCGTACLCMCARERKRSLLLRTWWTKSPSIKSITGENNTIKRLAKHRTDTRGCCRYNSSLT